MAPPTTTVRLLIFLWLIFRLVHQGETWKAFVCFVTVWWWISKMPYQGKFSKLKQSVWCRWFFIFHQEFISLPNLLTISRNLIPPIAPKIHWIFLVPQNFSRTLYLLEWPCVSSCIWQTKNLSKTGKNSFIQVMQAKKVNMHYYLLHNGVITLYFFWCSQ